MEREAERLIKKLEEIGSFINRLNTIEIADAVSPETKFRMITAFEDAINLLKDRMDALEL